ncbi:hypothetical protein ACTHOQ_15200 [Solibacillus silvestris]|uniref:hypothetical protein n=1 Tax=Solibacillus silvestris TaxID=76853 RepID=UPI003F800D37
MISEDWRIRLCPNNLLECKRIKEERAEFLIKHPIELWSKRTESAAIRILQSLGVKFASSSELNEEKQLEGKIAQVAAVVMEEHAENNLLNTEDLEIYAICIGLGVALAKFCPTDYKICEQLAEKLFCHHPIYEAWLEHFPKDKFDLLEQYIIQLPYFEHPLELARTWGYYRKKRYWDSYDGQFKFNEQYLNDEWRYITESRHIGRGLLLANAIRFKNDLLFAKDKRQWVKWLTKLPNIHIQMAAISPIRKLELWKEVLVILFELSCLEQYNGKKEIKLLAALFLYEYFDAAEAISNQLSHYATDHWIYLDEHKEILHLIHSEKENWQSKEWPYAIKQLVERLSTVNITLVTEMILLALCHIQIDALPKKNIYKDVRKVCIEHLLGNFNEAMAFLHSKQTQTSLLVAMLLCFEADDMKACGELWDGYLTVIGQKEFYWSIDFQQDLDYFKFAWLSAGILAQLDSPFANFMNAVERINEPKEGWGILNERTYETDKRIVHLYIVGVMASEWLAVNGRREEAILLYNYVFHETTKYLRKSIPYSMDFVDQLIMELWGRLPCIKPTDYIDIALYTIPLYDEYKHILLALTVLHRNSQNAAELKMLMQEMYEELFPLEKIKHCRNEKLLKWYDQFDWWME